MKRFSDNKNLSRPHQGFSLIEAILFSFLVSLLIVSFMQFASSAYASSLRVIDKVNDAASSFRNSGGFMASSAVILIASGLIVFAAAAVAAAATYSDAVEKQELRIQARLNLESCFESLHLMYEKDLFMNGVVNIPEFGCIADVQNTSLGYDAGHIIIKGEAQERGVTWMGESEYTSIYPR